MNKFHKRMYFFKKLTRGKVVFDKRTQATITNCDHPSVEIEKEILSEIDLEFLLAHCNT